MTNHCYCYRGIYDMYRGGDPVKLNQQFFCRKRIRNRLFHKGKIYWFGLDVLREVYEIHRTMVDTVQYRIHCIMHRIAHFERIVCRIAKLEASILIAIL